MENELLQFGEKAWPCILGVGIIVGVFLSVVIQVVLQYRLGKRLANLRRQNKELMAKAELNGIVIGQKIAALKRDAGIK